MRTKHSINSIKSMIAGLLAMVIILSTLPGVSVYAAQSNEYVDPADVWIDANARTNELDMNATTTYETQYCTVCNRDTLTLTYRVPEYTKSGTTALNRGVKYSDGTCIDGVSKGNLDDGMPGKDAYYTGYHLTKSVCQVCGTFNSVNGEDSYDFNRNVYSLYSCDHNFYLDFDNTTYVPYNENYHTTTLKKGQYCQFCKGTFAKASQKQEKHNFVETVDAQIGNNRFFVTEECEDCGYETSEYVTAKSVIASYYGKVDGDAHTVTVTDLSDNGVKTSIRYGNAADSCTMTSAPNFTKAGYNTVYYKITYSYDGEAMEENGVSYVWLLEEPKNDEKTVIIIPPSHDKQHTHDFRYIDTIKPSCTNLGYEVWQCMGEDACGQLEKRNYTPTTGHTYKTTTIREATCTQGGLKLHICENCGDFYEETTPTAGHHYHANVVNPTCKAVGFTEHTCENCGDTYITDITPMISHSFERITKKPTCTDKGYTTATCTNCGYNYVSDYTEPVGHSWDDGHTITSSTCDAEGVIEYHCKNCDEKMIKATSAKGHTHGTPATCTDPEVCKDCGTILAMPKGHTYESKVIPATCTSMGYTVNKCRDCGDEYISDYTNQKKHNYHKEVTAPTCTTSGYTTYTCIACGDEYVSDYTDKLPHNFEAVVTSPTCTAMGFTTYICKDCGESYVGDYTDVLPHNYNKETVEPTCTEHGYAIYTCPDCGKSYIGDYTDEKEHHYTKTVIPPTCTTMGYTIFTCDDCGDTYKGEYVEQKGHTPSDWIIDVPATIEHAGEKHIECTECHEVLSRSVIAQLIDTDRSDEDGKSEVGDYFIILTDKNGKPVFDSEIVIDVNDNIFIKLPNGRLLDYNDQTTVTVIHTDSKAPANGLNIFIYDKNNNAATGTTDENGQVKLPNNQSSTTDDSGTIGGGDEDKKETYVVRVTDKNNVIITNCDVYIGESNNIVVDLPDGIKPTGDEPVIVTVIDQDGNAQVDVTVIVLGDADFIEKGKTDMYGKVTLPSSNEGYTDKDGKVRLQNIYVVVNDETKPIENAYVKLNDDGTITVVLPDGSVISYDNRITITVSDKDGNAIENISVTVSDNTDNSKTDFTNDKGQITVPALNEDITDKDGNAKVNGYNVNVSDETKPIENAFITIGEGQINVILPDGVLIDIANRITVTVTDEDNKPVKGVSVTVTDKNKATATKSTDANGQITVPIKSSSGGGSSRSSGGGGSSISTNTTNIKVVDKDGNVVTVTKSTDSKGNITLTLPNGKTLDGDNYYTITATDNKGAMKPNVNISMKDKNNNSANGVTDSKGILVLPGTEHKAYIVGYEDGTFRPNSDMSRAEAATIFARLISDEKGEAMNGKSSFKDISSKEWYSNAIGYLEKYDIIKGYSDNTFNPDEPVTRAEFVTMAVRYYDLFNDVKIGGLTVKYTDVAPSYWAYDNIAYAKNIGWLNGYADGTFKGDNNITRAEVVTVVNHATARCADEKYINANYTKLNRFTDVKDSNEWYFSNVFEAANTHIGIKNADSENWVK